MVEKTHGLINSIILFLAPAFYGLIGAVVNYFYKLIDKDASLTNFRFPILFVHGLFGFVVGITAGKFIPTTVPSRDGILIVLGYMALHILGVIEDNADNIFTFSIKKMLKLDMEGDKSYNGGRHEGSN